MKIVFGFMMAIATLMFNPSTSQAADFVNTGFFGSTAIKGYDAVAYHTQSKPVEGSKEFTVEWNDATWRFSSAENRDLFKADPTKYAPQYGGWCAYAMAQGKKVNIDPEAWKIVDGKLYLNYSKKVQADWSKDIPGYVTKADAEWNKIKS